MIHGGIYSVKAENDFGQVTNSACLIVDNGHQLHPRFIKPLSDLTIEEGQKMVLECHIEAWPGVTVQW